MLQNKNYEKKTIKQSVVDLQTSQDFVLTNFETEREATDVKSKSIPSTTEDKGMGSILADTLPHYLKVVSKNLKTNEPTINGLDLASYLIDSLSSLSKVASLFVKITKEQSYKKELKSLIDSAAHLIKHKPELHAEKQLKNQLAFSIQQISPNYLPEFIEKAKSYIDDRSEYLNSNRDVDWVYEKFLNHFNVVNSLQNKSEAEKYLIKGDYFNEVLVVNSELEKEIRIKRKNNVVYYSEFKNGSWTTKINELNPEEKKIIHKLPQTKKEIVLEYSGQYLGKYLLNQFESDNNSKNIDWQYDSNKLGKKVYRFSPYHQDNCKLIDGKDENGLRVFLMRVSNTKAVTLVENKIPIEQLAKFVQWHKSQQLSNKISDGRKK